MPFGANQAPQVFVSTVSHGAEKAVDDFLFIVSYAAASRNQFVDSTIVIKHGKLVDAGWQRERSPVPSQQSPCETVEVGCHDSALEAPCRGTGKRRQGGAHVRPHPPRRGDAKGQGHDPFWWWDFTGCQQPACSSGHRRRLPIARRRLHKDPP